METYIGQRYVPQIEGVWNQLKVYENLSIVTFNNTSYTSKKIVPAGVDILNEIYWVKTGDYIAQVDEFKEEVNIQLAQNESELNQTVRTSDNRLAKILFGVIRKETDTWQFITDATHQNLNLASLATSGNALRLTYNFTSKTVGSLIITPDDYMSSKGITAGASVGVGYADLFFYGDLELSVKADGTIPYIPKHLENIVSVAKRTDGTGITVTHPAISDGLTDFPFISQMQDGDLIRGDSVRVAWSPNQINLIHYKQMSGIIYYDGTKWVVETDNLIKPTVSFLSGKLTIIHSNEKSPTTNLGGINTNTYTSSDTSVKLSSLAQDRFIVDFVDGAGNLVTDPNTNMRFSYSRNFKVQSLMPESMRFVVKRGKVQIPALDVVTGSNGNFWVMGLMNI